MKKRIFSLLLALCLVAGMLPTVAYAAEPSGTKLTKDILESTYKVSSKYILPSGNYYLGENISVDTSITIGDTSNAADVTLDLNGYTLKNDTNGVSLLSAYLYVSGSTTLTLMDSSSAKTGEVVSSSGYTIQLGKNTELNANGGTVRGSVRLYAGIESDTVVIDNTDPSNVTVFTGEVANDGTINGGTFNGTVNNNNYATIKSGTFYGTVNNNSNITGGTFYGTVNNNNNYGTINSGTFYGTVNNNNGNITGGTFNGDVVNYATIKGGIFYGTVSGSGTIEDSAKVTVTFNSDGGSSMTEQKVLRGQKATAPTEPTKAGYSFNGWYQGNTEFNFANTPVIENITLTAKWDEKFDITFDTTPQPYTYDGSAQAFSITGTAVTGFDIAYKQNGQIVTNPTNAGYYDVIVTRAEDDTYKAVDVTISNGLVINPKAVTATISAIPNATYTGSDIEPAITVYDGQTVIPASEYTVSYSGNRNAGTATVTLTDKAGGNYVVSGTTTFEILTKSIEDADITLNGALTYNGTEQTQNVTFTLAGFDTVTFDVSNNKQTDVNTSGDYTLTVTGNGNFTGSKNLDWNIAPATPTENPAKKTTARVVRGRTLADATVTNGEILGVDGTTVLTGTFAWVDSTKVMRADGTEQMIFTPDDTNYVPITIDVAVSTYTTGGGSVSTYAITVESTENGTVTITPKTASRGTTVTLTVEPAKGYTLETLTVTDKNGNEIELTNKGDGKYTFTMPASKVTVKVVFRDTTVIPFADVPADAYYYNAVQWAVKNRLTYGTSDTAFSPDDPCTRAQVVTLLWRAAGSPTPKSREMPFTDVVEGSYYYDAVLWAVENGITGGTSATAFSPDATCDRAQFATFLWRSQGKPAAGTANPFTDVAEDTYYTDAVLWAAASGITEGTSSTTFSPNDDCTRAQVVTFLYRCLSK